MPAELEPIVGRPRRWRLVIAAVGILAVALLAAAHLPFVRARLLARIANAAAAYGLHLEASRLGYNLVTLTARLDNVRLSATGATPPFLTADAIAVDLSWAIFGGGPRVETIAFVRPHVAIVRRADGTLNLPAGGGSGGPGTVPALPPGGLQIADLAVDYTDTPLDLVVQARGLALDFATEGDRITAAIAMAEPAAVRTSAHATEVTTLDGRLSYDGLVLTVAELVATAPEGRARVTGSITGVTGAPRLDLGVEGHADLAEIARWTTLNRPPAGRVEYSGAVSGAIDAPVATLTGRSDAIDWPPIGVLAVTARAAVTRVEVTVESFGAALAGGRITGRGRLRLDDNAPSEITANWEEVGLDILDRVAPDLGVRAAATSAGTLTLSWLGDDVFAGRGSLAASFIAAPPAGRLPLDGRLDLALRDRRWALNANHVVGASTGVEARLAGRLEDRMAASTIGGDVTVTIASLGDARRLLTAAGLVADIDPSLAADGSATISARVAGTFGAPRAAGTIDAANVIFRGVGPGSLTTRFAATTRALAIDGFRLDVGPNVMTANGTFTLDTRAIDGTVNADLPDLSAVAPALPLAWRPDGALRMSAAFSGLVRDPVADVVLSSSGMAVAGQVIQSARATGRFAGRIAAIQTLELTQAGGRLTASGHYELDTRRYAFTAAGTGLTLAPIVLRGSDTSPVPVTAVIGLALNGEGSIDTPGATGHVTFDELAWDTYRVGTVRADVALAGDRLDVTGVAPVLGGRLEGLVDLEARTVRARAEFVDTDLALLARPSGPGEGSAPDPGEASWPVTATGRLSLSATAEGPIDAPAVTARALVAGASIATRDLPAITDLDVAATFTDGVLDVTEIAGRWQGATITGTARVPARTLGERLPAAVAGALPPLSEPAAATVRVTALTAGALAPFLDSGTVGQLAGTVDLSATLTADRLDLESLEGDVTLDRADVEIARVALAQSVPTRLRLASGALEIVDWRWAGPGSRIDLSGTVQLTGESPALDLGMTGTLDLRMLSAFSPNVAVAGAADVDVRAAGTTTDPVVEGQIAIADTDVVLREPRVAITGLAGTATLTPDQLTITRATGSLNGGALDAAGTLTYDGLTIRDGAITFTGRGVAFEVADGPRMELDAGLTLAAADGHQALVGSITILRGDYRRPLRLTEQLFANRAARAPVFTDAAAPGGWLDDIRLNVSIDSTEDLIVENNYGRLEIATNLALIGTVASPALAGRLLIREGGEVFLGGQTYTVRRGTVDFTNPSRIDPTFDLALDTRVQRNDITLELRGTPETLDVALRSPGLSQQDAVSLLLTGQVGDGRAVAHTEIARGQLLMLLSGELLDVAGRAVGLDAIQLGRGLGGAASTFDLLVTESSPDARLTLTKSLRRDVELIVSQSLRESGDITWIAAYHPVRRVELRATTDDANNQSYEFRHEVPFGGARSAVTAVPRDRPPAPRVAATRIRGVDGRADRDAIDRTLSLRSGDSFDFYRWLQDRDRLLAHFHDRGHLEARLTARREDAGPGGVILDYEITPGPRTTLRVEGVTLAGNVTAAMTEAWSQAVFDGFLVDDLTAIARQALVADGYLQADVRVNVSPVAGDEKTTVVRVTPGPRFDDRRIVFDGNVALSTSVLEAVLRERNLETTAWLDPNAIAPPLEERYRSIGHLAVAVSPGVPAFAGGTATLPVQIVEGPAFRITAVDVDGARSRSADDIRRLAALEPGAMFEAAAIEPARRRVEADYLRLGFNDIKVTAAVRIDEPSSAATVMFTIVEGRKQVLAAVDVAGVAQTTRGTIDRALSLEVGQPVDFGTIYTAQKRLYDTSVFQSVDITVTPVEGSDLATPEVQPMRATVAIEEYPPFRLRYGVRAIDVARPAEGTRTIRPGFVADLLNRNVAGRAVMGGIAGQIETDRWLGRAVLSLPSLFSRAVVTNLFLTVSREDFIPPGETGFTERSREFTVEQRLRPARAMAVTYGYSFAQKHVYELEPDLTSPLPPLDIRVALARLTGTYAWDTRDDASNASRGWFHSSGIEFGVEALGSDQRYIRYLAQQYYFRPIGRRAVFASALRIGAGRGFGQDLVPSEKFYAGGGTSLRGFAELGVGGTDFFGDPVGGNGLVLLTEELRVRVFRWINAVGFLDAGNVFSRARELTFGDLEAGAGVGVRIVSPFAIFRLDVGLPLTSRRTQPAGRWYFGIGQTF